MSSPSARPPEPGPPYDPVFLNSRRELLVIVAMFAVFCLWAIAISYSSGYVASGDEPIDVSITLGIPSWAFWGLLVPWVLVNVVAVWFCFSFMKDDDLGEAHEGEDLQEQIEHLHEEERRHE